MVGTIERTAQDIESMQYHPVWEELPYRTPGDQPETLLVPKMRIDQETRQQAERFIGMVACRAVASEAVTIEHPIGSLYEAIPLAAAGDENAIAMIKTNSRTDVIERTLKTGHVMEPITLSVDQHGKTLQYDQTTDAIYANSLLYAADHPVMRLRTQAETRNKFRIEALHQNGYFDDYSLVVLSPAEADLPEAGFFTETMSCSIQVTSKQDKALAVESAFVSGVTTAGAPRHDIDTIVELGRRFGMDFSGKTPADIIDTPILVRNDLIPHGAIDVVRLYDDVNGTFFGEQRPREDYLSYREKCRVREQGFEPKVTMIASELIAEASRIHTPMQAVRRLHEISEKHMVEYAVADTTIDPLVFGRVAARHVEAARMHHAMGNFHDAHNEILEAQESAESYSCPSMMQAGSSSGEDKYGSLDFKCPRGHSNTRPKNTLIERCQTCKTSVRC